MPRKTSLSKVLVGFDSSSSLVFLPLSLLYSSKKAITSARIVFHFSFWASFSDLSFSSEATVLFLACFFKDCLDRFVLVPIFPPLVIAGILFPERLFPLLLLALFADVACEYVSCCGRALGC